MNKIPKGWRELIREEHNAFNNKPLTLSDLKRFLTDIYKEKVSKLGYNPMEYPKHYVWEEDGVQYSMWELKPGMFTGDGGMEYYSKSLKELSNSLINE